jgi:menaquinone-dependent protoporphyrinogen oxidase
MKVLILYGTTEGQTRKICAFLAERLRAKGAEVALADATAGQRADPSTFDAAILAASLHVGQYQRAVVDFAREHHARLNAMPSAFVSVSLAAVDSDPEERESLATCTDNFKAYTGWAAAEIHHVAGAIRIGAYDFFKRWLMRLVAWEKRLTLAPGQDLELTDWSALATTADALYDRFARKA